MPASPLEKVRTPHGGASAPPAGTSATRSGAFLPATRSGAFLPATRSGAFLPATRSGASSPAGRRDLRGSATRDLRAWLGLLPFLLFAAAFLLAPSFALLAGSFQDDRGGFTFANIAHLFRPALLRSYLLTVEVSLVSAVGGGLFGFLLAWAVTLGRLPRVLRGVVATFSGVASNFAGVPLAFAFIATLGRVGIVTTLLGAVFGVDLYGAGFNLYSFWGLSLTYLYFQIPLMVLIITPALDGIRPEWREACENLGGTGRRYWTSVVLPVLIPSLLSSVIVLFGNAFGAYATAYALTGGLINLVPIQIGAQIRGDVLHDPNLGYALALGMVVIMILCILGSTALQRRASRWRR